VHGPLYVGFLSNRFWLSELYIKFSELYIKCFRTIYKIPELYIIHMNMNISQLSWGYICPLASNSIVYYLGRWCNWNFHKPWRKATGTYILYKQWGYRPSTKSVYFKFFLGRPCHVTKGIGSGTSLTTEFAAHQLVGVAPFLQSIFIILYDPSSIFI
jgi:hypothetical protein